MLYLLFIVLPFVELYLLLFIGSLVGFWPTLLLVVVTGVLGASLARREGSRVLREWQSSLARGEMPEEGVLGGLLVLVGGVLLVTPGVLTDVTGVLLLLPPTRRLVARWLGSYAESRIARSDVTFTTFGGFGPGGFGEGFPSTSAGGSPFDDAASSRSGGPSRSAGSTRRSPSSRQEPPPPSVIDVYGEEIDPSSR